MHRPVVCALTSMALAAIGPAAIAKKPITPTASFEVRWPGHPSIAPDGRSVVFEIKDIDLEKGSTTHLYLVPAVGGARRRLTHVGRSNSQPAWSPDGRRLAFVGRRGDQTQLYAMDVNAMGDAAALTDLSTGVSGPMWSADGRSIVFVSHVDPSCSSDACNKKAQKKKADDPVKARVYDELLYRHWNGWDEGTRDHIFVVATDGKRAPRDLTHGRDAAPTDILNAGAGYTIAGDSLVFARHNDRDRARSTNNDLFTVKLDGGKPEPITTNPAWDGNPVASPSGRYVAYTAFRRAGFEADRAVLHIYDRTTNKTIARTDKWNRSAREIVWTHDDAALYVVAYDRAHRVLYRLDRDAGPVTPVVTGQFVSSIAVGPSGEVVYVGSRLDAPPELWRYDPKTKKKARLTALNDKFVAKTTLGEVTELVATTNDSTKVHGLIVKPPGMRRGRKYPLVVLIHGGPQGAWSNVWHPRWNPQLFASPGHVIALPNPRGSIGYGQAYVDAVTKDWGGGPFNDILAFTDAAEKLPFVKPNATCAAGASYGGYMVNWIAGHTDRYKCLISHAGVFNLESMWGDTEELWFPEWEMGGAPWEARERYKKWSPHRFIHHAKTPTLVIHGQLDYRVHLSQGQQMFTSLRRLGVPARFVYFPDEGHWIQKPKNFVFWYDQMLTFLKNRGPGRN